MDLLWMVLLVVLVCAEVQNVTEVKGDLDGDVTLNCSIRNKDIHWFMEIHNQFRVKIGRTYSSSPDYCYADFETKYLIQENRLVIKNLTAQDSRIYFCGVKKDYNITVVDTFHLISVLPKDQKNETCRVKKWQEEPLVFSSFCLNGVLIFVVIGLTCVRMKNCGCRTKDRRHLTPDNPQTPEPQPYEEIHLPPFRHPSECLYSVAQLPR